MKNNPISSFFIDVREEIKKISWPSSKQTINTTLLVIGATVVVGLYIGAIDYLLTLVIKNFLIK
ncbi:MAG: preprotein translocase subunit SecE [Patescibacteria group bacterium]